MNGSLYSLHMCLYIQIERKIQDIKRISAEKNAQSQERAKIKKKGTFTFCWRTLTKKTLTNSLTLPGSMNKELFCEEKEEAGDEGREEWVGMESAEEPRARVLAICNTEEYTCRL